MSLRSDGNLNRWFFDVLAEDGTLFGREEFVGVERVLIRRPDGTLSIPTDIPVGQQSIYATDSNDLGTICGGASTLPNGAFGWTWSNSVGFQVLPLEPCSRFIASAINNAGWILQNCASSSLRPILHRPGLPPLPMRPRSDGDHDCRTVDMNNNGVVVAEDFAFDSDNRQIGILWRTPDQLADILDVPTYARVTAVRAINDPGAAVGSYLHGSVPIHTACKWLSPNERIDLQPLVPGQSGRAHDINGSDIVVGDCNLTPGITRGAVWLSDNSVHDISTLVDATIGQLTIINLYHINDAGWILGYAERGTDGQYVLLIPHSTPCCTSDINGDCRVDVQDLVSFIGDFGGPAAPQAPEDLNNDGFIDTRDLVILLGDFNNPCSH